MDSRLILAYNLGPRIKFSDDHCYLELEGNTELQCGFLIRNDILGLFNNYKLIDLVRNY